MQGRNPSPIPADTDPEVWRLQMAAIGRRSVASRLDQMAELLTHGARIEADAVRGRHPDYSDEQIFLALMSRCSRNSLTQISQPSD